MKYLLSDIKYYGLLKTIKYAYQRAVHGYDETIYWEFDSYFIQFLEPLKKFCRDNITNSEVDKMRTTIFLTTLEKIKAFEEMDYKDQFKKPNAESKMWIYIAEHIGWYWD